ncbi:MAG: hypothetical protein ACLP05_13270 [Candidatus Kryptoniota bacterium]
MKWLSLVLAFFFLSCENIFAPKLATQEITVGGILSDQTTIDGVFQNFVYAYTFMDTSVYTKLIAPNFTFTYWDYDNNVPVAWGRDDEMRSTYNMFELVNRLTLSWNSISSSTQDSLHATVTRAYTLEVAFNPADITDVDGTAYFEMERSSSSAPWQISLWQDITNP